MIECRTVGDLMAALQDLPVDAPLCTLYGLGVGAKRGLVVRGVWSDSGGWALPGDVVLDIDPVEGS